MSALQRLAVALVVILVAALALYGAYWYVDAQGFARGKKEVQGELLKQKDEVIKAYITRLNIVEENYAKDKVQLDSTTAALAKFSSVQIHIPVPDCGSAKASPDNGDAGAGLLSAGVDEEFARLQGRASALFKTCDELNLSARKANGLN